MGLKITNEIATDKGLSSEVYLMIDEITINKRLKAELVCKTFKSKADRDADINNICKTFNIPLNYSLTLASLNVTVNDLYILIKNELETKNLTSEEL